MKADAAVQGAQDEVALLTARFDVRRAELDASGNEFIGAIDAQKNVLSLEEAQRRLAQLEEDVKSRAATNNASLAVVQEKRTKAQLGMQRAQQVIDSLVLRAPLDGVVSLKENRDAPGGMMFCGMILPEYRAGDQVWPGRPVADVIEAGRMEVRAKVDESDRGNLIAGQPATVADRRAARRDIHGARWAAGGTRKPRELLGRGKRDASVRCDLSVRPAGPAAEGGGVRARHHRGQGRSRRASCAAAGRLRQKGQDLHVRESRRPVRAARGQGGAAHREPSCDLRTAGRHRNRAGRSDGTADKLAAAPPRRPSRRPEGRDEPGGALLPPATPTSCQTCGWGWTTSARTSCGRC